MPAIAIPPSLAALAVPVHSLQPHPANARRHDDRLLIDSLQYHGQYRPLVVQRSTGYVLAGNGTLAAARELGWDDIAVTYVDVDDDAAIRILLIDNRASDLAGYDDQALTALLAGLGAEELTGTGYDPAVLEEMLGAGDGAGLPTSPNLADRFGMPPFTVLDARSGSWRTRKREWLTMGMHSELGRDVSAPPFRPGPIDHYRATRSGAIPQGLHGKDAERFGRKRTLAVGLEARRGADGSLSYIDMSGTAAVSIFDPVLCELVYRWFSATGHRVLDPWAGGSVRGLVAAVLGRDYTGVELRPEQVAANREQLSLLPGDAPRPQWVEGESAEQLRAMPPDSADLLFGCPPYYSLERYSDDPRDLSTMTPAAYDVAYAANLAAAARVLAPDSFAVYVVGNVRDAAEGHLRDLAGVTIRACEDAGLHFYNDAILVTPLGSLPVRTARAFSGSRVLGRAHQQVLIFYKGDRRRAAERCGTVDTVAALAEIDEADPDGVDLPA